MFGLAEQIHGHPLSRCAAIGQDQNFRGAGDHVDAHGAKHSLFGAGHIGVARTGDFVDLGDGGGAVGQRSHGLRATHRESAAHTGHTGGGQHQGVAHACWRGHHHDDLLHPGHMGGNRVHQHRGGVSGFATRHINAHAVQWRDFLAEQRAVFVAVAPTLARRLFLRFVVLSDTGRRGLQSVPLRCRQAVQGSLQLGLGDLQGLHAGGLQSIKTLGVLQHRRITALLHIGQDGGHALLDGGVGVGRPMQAGPKSHFKTGICRVQLQGLGIKRGRRHRSA